MKVLVSIPAAIIFLFLSMGFGLGALDFYAGEKAQSSEVVDLKY